MCQAESHQLHRVLLEVQRSKGSICLLQRRERDYTQTRVDVERQPSAGTKVFDRQHFEDGSRDLEEALIDAAVDHLGAKFLEVVRMLGQDERVDMNHLVKEQGVGRI